MGVLFWLRFPASLSGSIFLKPAPGRSLRLIPGISIVLQERLICLFFLSSLDYFFLIATHCDNCGIKALDNESFAEERFSFRSARKYCPACYARLYQRVHIVFFIVFFLFASVPILLAFYRGDPVLEGRVVLFGLAFLLQYLLVIPHELGHAFAARAFGFSQIRIVIGVGKPFFHFQFLGFQWLLNSIPFGGLTYARPNQQTLTRAKWILFASGGLIVNGLSALVAWLFLPGGIFIDGQSTPSDAVPLKVFFWSNLFVLIENLVPLTIQTGFGRLSTDGKLLFDAFFFWNKAPLDKDELVPLWQVWTARLLKLLILFFLGICTLTLIALSFVFIFAKDLNYAGLAFRFGLFAFFLILAIVLGFYTWRVYSQPVATKRKSEPLPATIAWLNELQKAYPSTTPPGLVATIRHDIFQGDFDRALVGCDRLLATYPEDLMLLATQAGALGDLKEYARAEAVWDRILRQIPLGQPSLYVEPYSRKLSLIMLQSDIPRFTSGLDQLLSLPLPDSAKVLRLDQLASTSLFLDLREFFPLAEFCLRRALEIAPGNLTLQGTLGALLVERGECSAAEPHLRACYDRSSAHHDRGIASLYLALIVEHSGDLKTAKTLARQSTLLYSESWLLKKAEALLARLDPQS